MISSAAATTTSITTISTKSSSAPAQSSQKTSDTDMERSVGIIHRRSRNHAPRQNAPASSPSSSSFSLVGCSRMYAAHFPLIALCSLLLVATVVMASEEPSSAAAVTSPHAAMADDMQMDKRRAFAFAKRRAFAFAKRGVTDFDFGNRGFAFAKRSPQADEVEDEMLTAADKRFDYGDFGGGSRFAFAKRSPYASRFAFAKRWPQRSFAFA